MNEQLEIKYREAFRLWRDANYEAAIVAFTPLAEQGHAMSCFNLGSCYYRLGRYTDSLPWLEAAAERGVAPAYWQIGEIYEAGYAGPADPVRAAGLYRESADRRSPHGAYLLARLYENGVGVDVDVEKAEALLRQAVELGSSLASHELGQLLYRNRKSVVDLKEAARWCQMAADLGVEDARRWERCESASWYRELVEKGGSADGQAEYQLGRLALNGIGGEVDHREALRWYRLAADKGHVLARCYLGMAHANGIGVKKNPQQAEAYFSSVLSSVPAEPSVDA